MRIVFYTPVSLRNGAGAEQWQMAVAPVLQEEFGHQIEIIACDYSGDNMSLADVKKRLRGVAYTELPVRYLPGKMPLPSPAARRLLRQRLAQAEAVHYVFGFMGHDVLVNRYTDHNKTQVFAGFHAPILISGALHNIYVKTISHYLTLPRCNGFFVFNPDQAKMLQNWGLTQPVTSIAGCVDLERFAPPAHHPSTKTMELVRISRVAWDKGSDILCKSLRSWFEQDPSATVHVTIVGSGPMDSLVDDLARDFPDKVTHVPYTSAVEQQLYPAHVSLIPSREETFGIAMVEALAVGVPVLSTDADGPRRVITEGVNGWLVKRNSAAAFTAGMRRIYDLWKKDPAAWQRWQKPARQSVMEYSPQVIAQRIDAVISAKSI